MSMVGYAALIQDYQLSVVPPDTLCATGQKHKLYEDGRWRIFGPRYRPENTLQGHLTFALKYEGIDLMLLKALFEKVPANTIAELIKSQPTGAYSRRIWFLYEWLRVERLDIEDATQGNFVHLINEKLQYPGRSRDSHRHRVRNNLPGTRDFCPLIRRTEKLDHYIAQDLSQKAKDQLGKTHADLVSRAAAFLLLKDSKASYSIEGEKPAHNRIERWGKIIGQAGQRPISIDELERLQNIVIPDHRFILPGIRVEGGFVGEHDRATGMPLPVHISAKPGDLVPLLEGLIKTYDELMEADFDAILMATLIGFGFVFIHPFEDGNGRIHRYLFHHVLADKSFVSKGLFFPLSAVMLDRIQDYKSILEHYSQPRLELIEWRPTDKNNVEVLNETLDLYRFFDATKQAEFLFECVAETIHTTLPEEIRFLTCYDNLNNFITNYIDMPDKTIDLLIRFLNQNKGTLSRRAKEKEFSLLSKKEIETIENKYAEFFSSYSQSE